MKKTTTTTYEYDDEGTLLKETVVEGDNIVALPAIPQVIPVPYPAYPKPYYLYWQYPYYGSGSVSSLGSWQLMNNDSISVSSVSSH